MRTKDFFSWATATLIACLAAAVSGVLATLILHQTTRWANKISSLAPFALPLMMLVAGVLAGLIWWWVRLERGGSIVGVVRKGESNLLLGRSAVDAGLQVASVGFGASMGREAAPRLLAAALTWTAARKLSHRVRVLVTAGAAGGALGVVYDAPWAGAIYTLTILLPHLSKRAVATALVTSWTGVSLAKLALGDYSNYQLGTVAIDGATWLWVLVAILLAPVLGLGFVHLQKMFISGTVPLKLLPVTVGGAFCLAGLLGLVRPEVLGNGVLLVQESLAGNLSWQVLLVLIVVKACLTVLILSAGAVGGVLMPSFALGAALGGVGAALLPGANLAVCVMATAAAVLSVTEKSWLFGVVFALELVDAPVMMWLPVTLAGLGAYLLALVWRCRFVH